MYTKYVSDCSVLDFIVEILVNRIVDFISFFQMYNSILKDKVFFNFIIDDQQKVFMEIVSKWQGFTLKKRQKMDGFKSRAARFPCEQP